MRRKDRLELEDALRKHYRNERTSALSAVERIRSAADLAASAASAASNHSPHPNGLPEFIGATARSVPPVFWIPALAFVALATAAPFFNVAAFEVEALLVASGPALAAASLVSVVRARSVRMQELEASCLYNSTAVAFSRLMIFGVASLLVLAIVCGASLRIMPAGAAAAYTLAPYLLASAGGFMLARKVASVDAAFAAVAWSAGICVLFILLRSVVPDVYSAAAVWIWAVTAVAGALWLSREVVCWMRLSAEGGCSRGGSEQIARF